MKSLPPNHYETDELLSQYLLFHYGQPKEVLPYDFGPADSVNFPARCVRECVDLNLLPQEAHALDLGCAVGRSSFELAKYCTRVVGVDASRRFIAVAKHLQQFHQVGYARIEEGDIVTPSVAEVPSDVDVDRVTFEYGDATALRDDIGRFDVVLMANLLDRLKDPDRCLKRLPRLVKPGGQLIVVTPFTWIEKFTPRLKWLGGYMCDDKPVWSLEVLKDTLRDNFTLVSSRDMPILFRQHARKYEWIISAATVWIRD